MTKMTPTFLPLTHYRETPEPEMRSRALEFYEDAKRRRTVREYSDRPVDRQVIENCLRTAGTAPSGANLQPWHFVVVSDAAVKAQIRESAEQEERAFYGGRAPQEWLDALAPLGTDSQKPFLETAPILIAIFGETYGVLPDGRKVKHYYVQESVGIATGILIMALHHAGLVSLTHTPSPMRFLNEILGRPSHERPFLLLVVGYPAKEAKVPKIMKKSLKEFISYV
ncbi:MAG: nitroreductase family protein [Acidobacteriota bacterium]|jgi:nitroreductase|nr:nitroreductase family protein [Acidobacteriota bacterium]MCH2278565.1 nitroreductase family protein [Vicinamibacterales bacterium]MEC7769098.1 nitroreductase family protein [Acidobacteriota bacterium]